MSFSGIAEQLHHENLSHSTIVFKIKFTMSHLKYRKKQIALLTGFYQYIVICGNVRQTTLMLSNARKEMTANYKILCDIGDGPNFLIDGREKPVNFDDIDKEDNLNRIYRIQFKQPPGNGQLERVVTTIKKRPEIELRFYGNYSEDLIDWSKLTDIQNLQIDLWKTNELKAVSQLMNLRRLGINGNVKSKVSLKILEPLRNIETLYTSISKDVESISKLQGLRFLSLREIKHDNLDFWHPSII